MFVADDLVAWFVGLLADVGRKKLTTLVLGSEQQRALRQAASSAIQDTVDELSSAGSGRAEEIAKVISEVFREPVRAGWPTGQGTLLEALQAGIARQLAVLDVPSLTSTDPPHSPADVLGVPGAVLADKLTAHLVGEILLRGSRPGPLSPLATQLNFDRAHLQGQRMERMLAQLVGTYGAPSRTCGASMAAGRPLTEVTDPFALEVHAAVLPDDPQPGLPELPEYVPRDHDGELARVVAAASGGTSGIAVLVGGSSTGKTRACWEALRLLRDQEPGWRLWHPLDPSRPEAALRELPTIAPQTVVWLNEAQSYLDAGGGVGERVAAGLRELLQNPAHAPVLVLATMWPSFWNVLTTRPPEGPDPHEQARELLTGHNITVPEAFTPGQAEQLNRASDVRLAAAAKAEDGHAIQYLAGAPKLLDRYHTAPPAAAALINAAMDARRLGMGIGLPKAFLQAAAPGYLTDAEWDALSEDWLEQALTYTAIPCNGVRGPLTRIRPRPARSRATRRGSADSDEQMVGDHASIADRPLYRLADYLDQHGRAHRETQIPPAGFWAAAAAHAFATDQATLGDAAHARGLCRDAAQLQKNAAANGNLRAVSHLSNPPHYLRADVRPVRWAVAHVPVDYPGAVAELLGRLREAGAQDQITALLRRDPAAHVSLDDPRAVAALLGRLREAGAQEQATALAGRAAHVPVDDLGAVDDLLHSLQAAGAQEQAMALAGRAVAHVSLDDPRAMADLVLHSWHWPPCWSVLLRRDPAAHISLDDPRAVAWLLDRLREAGAQDQITALLRRDPAAHVSLDDSRAVAWLLDRLREAGAQEQARALAGRAAAYVPVDNLGDVADLLDRLREADAGEQVIARADRAVAQVSLDDPEAVAALLDSLRKAGAQEQVTALLRRDPAAHVSVDDEDAVAWLLDSLREAGAQEQAMALADRAATHVPVEGDVRFGGVGWLLDRLREAGAQEQAMVLVGRVAAHVPLDNPEAVALLLYDYLEDAQEQATALLRRDPATHVSLEDPGAVALLLNELVRAGAEKQARALASRAAANIPLEDPGAVARLLNELVRAGAEKQARALASRAAANIPLEDPGAVARLLNSGLGAQATTALLRRDPAAHVSLDYPGAVADLLRELRRMHELGRQEGAQEQATVLAGRAAAHVPLDNPDAVARLLDSLREAGALEQATVLAGRAAAHVPLDNPDAVARLLDSLREAGALEQATALADRLPGAGMFELFLKQEGRQDRFRFGREADGSPAKPWGWEDLD